MRESFLLGNEVTWNVKEEKDMMFGFWLIIALVVFAFYRMSDHGSRMHTCHHTESDADTAVNSALKTLNERYAKGEISQEEYRTKKQDLTK